ncbi:MAG: hypothetical protein ACJ71Q_09445 [Terriglobales bacterium]|jgi:hypothetical protein
MKTALWKRMSGLAILLVLATGIPIMAQTTSGLTVPVTGSNSFSGTATINKFVNQNGQIVAVGSVANAARTAFVGVSWQVTLSANTSSLAAYHCPAPTVAHLTRAVWSPDRQNGARLLRVQTSTSCGVLSISLGATTINIAGASVALDPIGINVSGQSGTPVGGIVCSLLSLVSSVGGIVGSVANVVNLLNSLLGSLTGALGGVAGGAGGAIGGLGGF